VSNAEIEQICKSNWQYLKNYTYFASKFIVANNKYDSIFYNILQFYLDC
jgi:hypothetical protein